jgi:hypothetical protein
MKSFILITSFAAIFYAPLAHAENYECFAKANANRGFKSDLRIAIAPAGIGGKIIAKTKAQDKELGIVSQVDSLDRSKPADKTAFEATLGYLNEEDVSGIAPKDLNRVSIIEVLRAQTTNDDEVMVYKLFAGEKQIGGSILISGMGTACLPR